MTLHPKNYVPAPLVADIVDTVLNHQGQRTGGPHDAIAVLLGPYFPRPVESYVVASGDRRCTVHPQHIMVNQGRHEAAAADLFMCACGRTDIGNTDESKARR